MVAMALLVSCSADPDMDLYIEPDEVVSGDDDTSTLAKGFSTFEFKLPLLDRFQSFVEEYGDADVTVEVYMRGRTVTDEYALSAAISIDRDSISVSAVDQTMLAELYHQDYFVNYMIVTGATRSSESDTYPEGAMVIGALLSATDPDDVYFVSTFSSDGSVSGSGVEFDPYIIADKDQFEAQIADKIDGGDSLTDVWFLQSNNINFLDSSIGCIGSDNDVYFAGHYDGGMMKISQLSIRASSNAALFYGIDEGAVFCNAIFETTTVTATGSESYCAVIAAHCRGGVISHVFIESGCNVSGYKYVGGFVGSGYPNIYNSNFRGTVTGFAAVGGFLGGVANHPTESVTIAGCVFSGTVTASDHCAGGIIGNVDDVNSINISDAYISGTVYADIDYTGGVIGKIKSFNSCEISNSYLGKSRSTDYNTYTNGSAFNSALTLDNYNPSSSASTMSYVGGAIGHATGNGADSSHLSLDGVNFNNATGSGINAKHCIGGALGYAKDLNFAKVDFYNYVDMTSDITSAEAYTGGAIGYCYDVLFSSDSYFLNEGKITASSSCVGGVIGYCKPVDSSAAGVAQGSLRLSNYGNVSSGNDNVGGCMGVLANSIESNDLQIRYINFGGVSAGNNVGGFVGLINGNTAMYQTSGASYSGRSSSAYNVIIAGSTYVGGLFGKIHTDSTTPSTLNIYGTTVSDVTGSDNYTGGIIGGIYNDVDMLEQTISFHEGGSSIVVNGGDYTGGVIGGACVDCENVMFLTIEGADVNSSTSFVSGGTYVGGVLGGADHAYGLDFLDCGNLAAVTGSNGYTGGILGGVDQDDLKVTGIGLFNVYYRSISIESCYNDATITSSGRGLGGLIGFFRSYYPTLKITKSCNWGVISSKCSDDSYAGGLFGNSEYAEDVQIGKVTISECYNAGEVSGASLRGGLMGRSGLDNDISSCFNMGSVSHSGSQVEVAGLVGSVDEKATTKFSYCYNIGVSGWGILGGENGSHPVTEDDCEYTNVYYLKSATNDDIDLGKDENNATWYTESQMTTPGRMVLNSNTFTTPSDMSTSGYLPYLTNVKYYKSYPKVSL